MWGLYAEWKLQENLVVSFSFVKENLTNIIHFNTLIYAG